MDVEKDIGTLLVEQNKITSLATEHHSKILKIPKRCPATPEMHDNDGSTPDKQE